MELENPSNGDEQPDRANTGGNGGPAPLPGYGEDVDSSCSTPYVSAPSSPGRGPGGVATGYFFSAPTSPMHFVLSFNSFSPPSAAAAAPADAFDFEFEFSSRCPSPGGGGGGGGVEPFSMSSADELFFNGQIRPMKLSSHLQRPQLLAPLVDVDDEEEDDESGKKAGARGRASRLRSRSVQRRARSMSPLRQPRFQWGKDDDDEQQQQEKGGGEADLDPDLKRVSGEGEEEDAVTPSGSASSSRSSSSGRNSKRWIFLKDLLYRSKSEGRERSGGKEKFWHAISFSPSATREKPKPIPPSAAPPPPAASDAPKSRHKGEGPKRAPKGASRAEQRGPAPSPHERHYTAKRAQAEEMRRRTFLPYRQGLLGCLGLSSRGYAAMNGLARSLNPAVSSR